MGNREKGGRDAALSALPPSVFGSLAVRDGNGSFLAGAETPRPRTKVGLLSGQPWRGASPLWPGDLLLAMDRLKGLHLLNQINPLIQRGLALGLQIIELLAQGFRSMHALGQVAIEACHDIREGSIL